MRQYQLCIVPGLLGTWIISGTYLLCVHPSGVGIRNCTKPPLGINPGIKDVNHGYRKKSNNRLLLHIIVFWKCEITAQKIAGPLSILSWNLAVLGSFWNTWNSWFFDYIFFFKYLRDTGRKAKNTLSVCILWITTKWGYTIHSSCVKASPLVLSMSLWIIKLNV